MNPSRTFVYRYLCKSYLIQLGDLLSLIADKSVLILTGLVCLLIVIVAVLGTVWPKQEKYFFELGLLGQDKTADSYFSKANSTVDIGDTNNWFINIHNHMGTMQDVIVKTKLLNSTEELPDDREHEPSDVASFAEFPISLSVNQTLLIPFYWSILEVEAQNDSSAVTILVNTKTVNVYLSQSADSIFRIVFELWVKNPDSGEYLFSWESNEGFCSASIYMGFRLNSN